MMTSLRRMVNYWKTLELVRVHTLHTSQTFFRPMNPVLIKQLSHPSLGDKINSWAAIWPATYSLKGRLVVRALISHGGALNTPMAGMT
jgi:hypothetical protein